MGQGVVHRIHADKRREALHIGILQNHPRCLLLQIRHAGVGHGGRSLQPGLQLAGVLLRKQAFGNQHIQQHGDAQRCKRHQQGQTLAAQNTVEQLCVAVHDAVKKSLERALAGSLPRFGVRLFLQPAARHHRHQRERHHRRNHNRDRQRDCKFAKQPAHHIVHKQQRDQDRNQRHRQRDDGETHLRGSGNGRSHRLHAFFDRAADVLQHHDGIVHHKAGGNGERHQAQVVQAVAQQQHRAAGTQQRNRHRQAGNHRGANVMQKRQDHQHHQQHRQCQLHLHMQHRCTNASGAVTQHLHLDRRRQPGLQLG